MSEVTLREKLVLMKEDFTELLGREKKEKVSYGTTNYGYFSALQIFTIWSVISKKHKVWLDKEITGHNVYIMSAKALHTMPLKITLVNLEAPFDTKEYLWSGAGENGTEKGFGSAITYGVRYFIQFLFDKTDGRDDPELLEHIRGNNKDKGNDKSGSTNNKDTFQKVDKKGRNFYGDFTDGYPGIAFMKTEMMKLYGNDIPLLKSDLSEKDFNIEARNIILADVLAMDTGGLVNRQEIQKDMGLNTKEKIFTMSFNEIIMYYRIAQKAYKDAGGEGWELIEEAKKKGA